MADNLEVDVGVLKDQVNNLRVEIREVRTSVSVEKDKRIEQGTQLSQLVTAVNDLTASSKKTSEKVDSILDDFHDSLLKQAEARQFWTWVRTNGPPFLTVILSSAAVLALIRLALMSWLKIPT